MPAVTSRPQIEQIPLRQMIRGLAQPIATIRWEPEDLTKRFGISFEEAEDDLDRLEVALLQTGSGQQFALVRHRHQPNPGTDILTNEHSADLKNDLAEAVRHLRLGREDVKWIHPVAKNFVLPWVRRPNMAFMRPVQPDAKLSAIVGSKPLPRSELTRKLWDYIKKNGLQDKKKRTRINADDFLKPVFNGKSQVDMFEMSKLVSGHIR
jgi:hypothetical protein